MPIIYHEKTETFHLYNDHMSYIMKVLPNKHLGQLYTGAHIADAESFDHLLEQIHRVTSSYPIENNREFSLEHVKLEYPTFGTSDYRQPAIEVKQTNGSRISEFCYDSHRIIKGKEPLEGLPHTYVENDEEAETLIITLMDEWTHVAIDLHYTIYEDYSAVIRHTEIKNNSNDTYYLPEAMSLNLDLPDYDYEWIQLSGAWGRERHIKSRPLEQGIQSIGSVRGHSSHQHNPFMALKRPHTTEDQGEVFGFSFVYSGNFLLDAEVDTHHQTRIRLGIHPRGFEWKLSPKETFVTPEVVLVYAQNGLNQMSQTFHDLYRQRLQQKTWRDQERPILINNWEATYFDFDEEKILEIAQTAKDTGVELFVLDDGWFGKRNDDFSGLGDWVVNKKKLPQGITGLSEKIHAIGMQFGLWFEPEMVNKDSDLYREHPEWVIQTPGRHCSDGRNQYVLDFSRPDVVDYIFEAMKKVISESKIDYIKWDMNRSMTEVYSTALKEDQQGEVMHRYMLGVYHLYQRLIDLFPNILFESCASGGARFDPGMLFYAPQAWTSDDSDAVERLKIQYGSSLVYPLSSMGAHVSMVPNEQVFRMTPLKTRANVAHFGTFGYELDLNTLTEEEREEIKQQITFHQKYRQLINQGTFYRLRSPFETNETGWMVVSKDRKQALVGHYKILNGVNLPYNRMKLKGLDPTKQYQIKQKDLIISGSQLMNLGLLLSDDSSGLNLTDGSHSFDFDSTIFELSCAE